MSSLATTEIQTLNPSNTSEWKWHCRSARRIGRRVGCLATVLVTSACSGGGDDPAPTPTPTPVPTPTPPSTLVTVTPVNGRISAASVFPPGCGNSTGGTHYVNAEVEPQIAVNPANPNNMIATWQQDRWSDGAAAGVTIASTTNGGATWNVQPLAASRCGGGNAGNGGDYDRATDPWVTFSPNGVAYQMSLSLTGASFATGSVSAMLVFRSTDGGLTWSRPATLVRDGNNFFNDKNAITADPTDSRFAYAVWDRLTNDNRGPALFARTTDGGATWEAARSIYDPGTNAQTIGNVIAVLPNGTLVNAFTTLRTNAGVTRGEQTVMRSTDKGVTWSAPIKVADFMGIGTRDPETGQAIRDGSFLPQISAGAQNQVYLVWQDARFSNGQRDAIALSQSVDGGLTWSAPARVSADPNTQAMIGTVHARADGVIGVSYVDLRNNTADATSLLSDHWLATSRDGSNWSDRRVTTASFNYAIAPVARGLFIGDYMGLSSSGANFLPLYVRTTDDVSNRTDVFLTPMAVPATAQLKAAEPVRTLDTSPTFVPTDAHRARVHANIVRVMEARRPGWAQRAGVGAPD